MRMLAWVGVVCVVSVGCQDTEECVELRRLVKSRQRALRAAKGRAALADRTASNLDRIKGEVEKKLTENGLDVPEGELVKTLEARAKETRGIGFERTVRPGLPEAAAPGKAVPTETVIRFEFRARSLAQAWSTVERLSAAPPLTRVLTFLAPKRRRGTYRLELGRIDIQRFPMDTIQPRKLQTGRKLEDVPSNFGFCGASSLRAEVSELDSQISDLQEKAGQTTVNLPLFASWTGLSRRADLAMDIEKEGRRIARGMMQGLIESKRAFIGMAIEKEAVVLEIRGKEEDLAKLQAELPKDLLSSVRSLESVREGVQRMAVGNSVASAGRRPGAGGHESGGHGPGGHGPDGHGPGGHGPGGHRPGGHGPGGHGPKHE